MMPSGDVCSFLFAFLTCFTVFAEAFNIQELPKSKVFRSPVRNVHFGTRVSMNENANGKWLIVGAPTYSSTRIQTRAVHSAKTTPNGAIFMCNLTPPVNKSLARKKSCSLLNINPSAREKEYVFTCNFENCTLENLPNQDINWTRFSGSTPSEDTGPWNDHTYEDSKENGTGHYLYMETSILGKSTRQQVGQSGMVTTPQFQATSGACVRFWYHMYGENIGSLNVYLHMNKTGLIMIWNENGQQGDIWLEGYVTVIAKYNYKIVFEGIKGDGYEADVAIDDVSILQGQCSEDIKTQGQSVGSAINVNPNTGELLACSPTWKHNCSGSIQAKGLCYLLDRNFNMKDTTILSPTWKQACGAGQVDLVFLVDESASLLESDFINVRYWLRNVISSLPISGNQTQVGIAVYNKETRVLFHLNEFHKIEDIRDVLGKAQPFGGYTLIGKAINFLTDVMFTPSHGMRRNARKVAVVITDAVSYDDVTGPATRAKAKGISMISIGVGKVSLSQLKDIASEPSNVYQLDSFDALEKIRSKIKQSITALESQGKTYTTQQSQAGFSSAFLNKSVILGLPGLNDWSGGYATYTNKQGASSQFHIPVTTSFQDLLVDYYTRLPAGRVSEIAEKFLHHSKATHHSQSNVITATKAPTDATAVDTVLGHTDIAKTLGLSESGQTEADKQLATERHRRSLSGNNEPLMTYAVLNTTSGPIGQQSFIDIGVNNATQTSKVKSSPTIADYQAVATSTMSMISATLDTTLPIPTLKPKVNILTTIQSLSEGTKPREDVVLQMLSNAYFGFSMTPGSFTGQNEEEFAVGAPKVLLKGEVYVINKSGPKDRIVQIHQGKQMGSYFGYAMCATDTNGDGIDELFVAAPLWLEKYEDEGRVFAYISVTPRAFRRANQHCLVSEGFSTSKTRLQKFPAASCLYAQLHIEGNLQMPYQVHRENGGTSLPKEVVLSGLEERGARFGFSIATAGDLNKDGFNDIAVGAPSYFEGDGAVYIYNGRPDIGITRQPTQILKASDKKKNSPIHFGFSIFAGVDVDGNDYNDIAVGSPGNDRVFVLYTRPVIHITVQLFAFPNVFNLSSGNLDEYTKICGNNGTALCSNVSVCFSAKGVSIPDSVALFYELQPDTELAKPRAQISKKRGAINVLTNQTTCKHATLYIKLPVRHQLTPLNVLLKYRLNEKKNFKAVLNVFDSKEFKTNITFANNCENKTCQSDLDVQCISSGEPLPPNQINRIAVIGLKKMIVIDVVITNIFHVAYDVQMDITFNSQELYLVQVSPVNGQKCIRNMGFGLLSDNNSKQTIKRLNILQLRHTRPIMNTNETCLFRLQFGIKGHFRGGKLSFNMNATSSSSDRTPSNNNCDIDMKVLFQSNYKFIGTALKEQTKFSGNQSSILYFDEIGPAVTHKYSMTNKGPAKIPNTTFQISWPTETQGGHDILYLTAVICEPKYNCKCKDLEVLVNSEQINKTGHMELMSNRGKGPVVFGSPQINPKQDKETQNVFHEVNIDCKSGSVICETLTCTFEEIQPSERVSVQLEFRVWKNTLQEARIWKASISSHAIAFTNNSKFLVTKTGKALQAKQSSVTTHAFNEDFAELGGGSEWKPNWWIYFAAISAGILLLLITMLLLKRAGFFKSKYRQHMEDEIEWKNTYQYTAAHQNLYEGRRDHPNNGEHKLSTFQRGLPQSPTL